MKEFAKIEEIYHDALEYSSLAERGAFLQRVCGGDHELRQEVESLLFFNKDAEHFIESPPMDLAADLFAGRGKTHLLGQEFKHYKILSHLGSGGMGEVYLAEDTLLGRRVALKLLPLQFSANPERKKLFEKEARAASALNHPNIITIFSIEQIEQYNFIATEFIDGQTLREKIQAEALSWSEAVEIAIQIAGAMESAHDAGIIHRDIKPANIMIRRDRVVKVLDFGLAKLFPASDADHADTRDGMDHGTVMGTLKYMSPEQALGQKIDRRTDIFSLGVVLYEMLSRTQPFKGNSDAAVYNATINENPPSLIELNTEIPPSLERIVGRAIAKKPEDRYQTMADLSRDLRSFQQNPHLNVAAKSLTTTPGKRKWLKLLAAVIAGSLFLTAACVLFFNRFLSGTSAEIKSIKYTQLTSSSGEELFPNLSPDGQTLIYSSREGGNWDIYSQRIGDTDAVNLTRDSTANDKEAAYSPDGHQIAFRSERQGGGIFVMDADGKNVKQISAAGYYPAWSPGGKEIAYCMDDFLEPSFRSVVPSEMWSINVATGESRQISKMDTAQPNWSPHGMRLAFWSVKLGGQRDIWTISADGNDPIPVTADPAIDWNPIWSADGKYLYFASDRSGSMNLWRVAIDEKTGSPLGEPEPITIPANYSRFFNFARDGKSFAFVQSTNYSNIFQIGFDPSKETFDSKPLEITHGSKIASNPEISPDNQTIAFDSVGDKQEDIFLVNRDGSQIRQLINDVYRDRSPHWSPDNRRLAFFSDITGIYNGWIMNSDGSSRKRLTDFKAEKTAQLPIWSPDGKRLIFNTLNSFPIIFDPDKNWNEQSPQQLPGDGNPNHGYTAFSWSPDGKKLIGYIREKSSARSSIAAYDFVSKKYEILTDFGTRPRWLGDNRRIIFFNDDTIYLLDSVTGKTKELLSVAPNRLRSLSLSKDNRAVFYTLQKSESDIWLGIF